MATICDFNKYDSILNDIEQEDERTTSLKQQVETCKNQLRIVEILNNPKFSRNKLFQVRVKVFRSIKDLLNVFPEKIGHEELSSPSLSGKCEDVNLYLIEVYVSRVFHEKLISKEWIVDFSVANANCKVCRSMSLKNRAANPITTIVPFPKTLGSANDEIVKVNLTSPTNWRQIELAAIQIDISYKFNNIDTATLTHNSRINGNNVEDVIFKINKIYNETSTIKDAHRNQLRYKLHYYNDRESFMEMLVRNSYQNLNPSQIISNEGNLATKIEINDQEVHAELNAGKKYLSFEAPGEELCQLKRYFTCPNESFNFNASSSNGKSKKLKKDFQHIQSVDVLKEVRKELMENLKYNRVNIHNLLNVYDVYNRFIDSCPL